MRNFVKSDMDRVWARLKITAHHLADEGKPLTLGRARDTLRVILRQECLDEVPDDVLEFLASSLVSLVTRLRAARITKDSTS